MYTAWTVRSVRGTFGNNAAMTGEYLTKACLRKKELAVSSFYNRSMLGTKRAKHIISWVLGVLKIGVVSSTIQAHSCIMSRLGLRSPPLLVPC